MYDSNGNHFLTDRDLKDLLSGIKAYVQGVKGHLKAYKQFAITNPIKNPQCAAECVDDAIKIYKRIGALRNLNNLKLTPHGTRDLMKAINKGESEALELFAKYGIDTSLVFR